MENINLELLEKDELVEMLEILEGMNDALDDMVGDDTNEK